MFVAKRDGVNNLDRLSIFHVKKGFFLSTRSKIKKQYFVLGEQIWEAPEVYWSPNETDIQNFLIHSSR